LGLGVDIVHLPRIASLMQRHPPARFAFRILSPVELPEWKAVSSADVSQQVRFLAVRWAAKEAAYKALYPRFRPTWKDLAITKESGHKPTLEYRLMDNREHGLRFHLSISHDGEYIFATVLVEEPH